MRGFNLVVEDGSGSLPSSLESSPKLAISARKRFPTVDRAFAADGQANHTQLDDVVKTS